ncbi:chaperone [Trichosporon asahii var. asahii CBS 8904]|uniref:Chaperone n=1 Tax=Trichosporon asahii var. asahii (strain CBS 8904) TaxID=1220162 RepID=K1VNB2_TRIAC|nr:chaperone [Trichosporon asahii var. asahii CBS 8904]
MSTLAYGLGLLGAGFAGRVAYQMMRGAKGADKFLKGGFKPKMDKAEAIQILGLRRGAGLVGRAWRLECELGWQGPFHACPPSVPLSSTARLAGSLHR